MYRIRYVYPDGSALRMQEVEYVTREACEQAWDFILTGMSHAYAVMTGPGGLMREHFRGWND